jgi:glutamine synthetase
MGDMLTQLIEDIIGGKVSTAGTGGQRLKLGVDKLPEIAQDNTDRNRTSPFAFTGAKFEFRAVGGSASIAFPVTLLNAAVAEAIGDLTEKLREQLKKSKDMNKAVLEVVREAFRESSPIRFEGNNYAEEWLKEAEKRGLLNLRHTPEALSQLVTKQSRALLTKLGILTKPELESRYLVRLERYVKDLLIELGMMEQLVDTLVLPAAYEYLNELAEGAANAKAAGIKVVPQVEAANEIGSLVESLRERRAALREVIERAEGLHHDCEKQAMLLSTEGAERMAEVRKACDALELLVADDKWPLPKYREMLFPV